MQCRELMNDNLLTCKPADTVGSCASDMRKRDVGFVPVVDDNGRIKGLVTDRDLCIRVLGQDKGPSTKIEDVMTKEWISVRPDDDLDEAERKMSEGQVQRIIVADGDRCVGVVSLQDVLSHEGRPDRVYRMQRAIKSDSQSAQAK